MSDPQSKGIAEMFRQLYQDSSKHKMYFPKTQLVFGCPLPQQDYVIKDSTFRNENGTLKAEILSHTPTQRVNFPPSIIGHYKDEYSPTMFASFPKKLKIRSDIVPKHKYHRRTGVLGEFLQPALRPLMDGDDEEVLRGIKTQAGTNEFPCPLCYGHSFMDVCHNYGTPLLRVTRLRDINFTLFLAGMHQVCPSCMRREYGHFSHRLCSARLSCTFCDAPSHDSTICTSAAHVSSLGDRFESDRFTRSEVCEAILTIDLFKEAENRSPFLQRKREILTRLATISTMLGLKVFKVEDINTPLIRGAVLPRWGLNWNLFRPVSAERARVSAAVLAAAVVPPPVDPVNHNINDGGLDEAVESDGDEVLPLDENFQQEINRIFDEDLQKDDINEEIGAIETPPEQVVEADSAGDVVLPRAEQITKQEIKDIVDVQHIIEETGTTETTTEQIPAAAISGEVLPLKDETLHQENGLIDVLDVVNKKTGVKGYENDPEQVPESNFSGAGVLPRENQDDSNSESSVMDSEAYAAYLENEKPAPDPPGSKDVFKEKDEDGPDY